MPQWWKICSISTTRASSGRCPLTTRSSRNGASRTRRARPLTRSVSTRPGTTKIRPTCGLDSTLTQPSARLLPGRSGITRVWSSSTCTKPAGSPFGETSQLPSAAEVAISRNGDAAIQARSRSCSRWRSLRTAPADGVPSSVAQLGLGGDLGPGVGGHRSTLTRQPHDRHPVAGVVADERRAVALEHVVVRLVDEPARTHRPAAARPSRRRGRPPRGRARPAG